MTEERQRGNTPVGVQAGDGGLAVAVQVLRLLQQDVVKDPRDVDGHIVLYGLQHCHVRSHAGQQLTGLSYLLGGLIVHGHPNDGPAQTGSRNLIHCPFPLKTPCSPQTDSLLGKTDLQVGGEVFPRGEGVLPHHQVGNVVDGETELR